MKIYLAHPISGLTAEQVMDYWETLRDELNEYWEVLQPMTAKGYFRNKPEERFVSGDYTNPFSTNHAIFERDNWMVNEADVVLIDFTDATGVSIGCVMELAWASQLRKHTIVVLPEEDKFHKHAFVKEAADIILPSLDAAKEYLRKLSAQEM